MPKTIYIPRKVSPTITFDNADINIGDVGLVDTNGVDINPATYNAQIDGSQRTKIYWDNADLSVQHPLPTDGDTIYSKDIDITNSSVGNFSGSITDLFDNYLTEITDVTTNNPKTLIIHLKRPLTSESLGLGSTSGNFSNVRILLKDTAGTVRRTIDDSTNSTQYTSNVYSYPLTTFIEIEIQFHTINTITLNGAYVPKHIHTISTITGINDVTGLEEQVKVDNGELIVGGKIGLKDSSNNNIDPAIETKQKTLADYELNDLEEASATLTYIGKETTTGTWLIQRLDTTTGTVSRWANISNNGTETTYTSAWTNRASLTYTTISNLTF